MGKNWPNPFLGGFGKNHCIFDLDPILSGGPSVINNPDLDTIWTPLKGLRDSE